MHEFKNCFKKDLLEKLSLKRDIDYIIEIDNERSSNKNAFSLFKKQLREQIKQMKVLLMKKLIQKNSSS